MHGHLNVKNSVYWKCLDDAKHTCSGKHLAFTNKYTTVQILNIENLICWKCGKIYRCPHVSTDSFPRWCRCLYRISCTVPSQLELYITPHRYIWNMILLYSQTIIPHVLVFTSSQSYCVVPAKLILFYEDCSSSKWYLLFVLLFHYVSFLSTILPEWVFTFQCMVLWQT